MQVLQKDLKAISLAMAVKDIRYYLQGVLFESNGAFTRLVATDGHRLHMVQTEDATKGIEAPVSFTPDRRGLRHAAFDHAFVVALVGPDIERLAFDDRPWTEHELNPEVARRRQ